MNLRLAVVVAMITIGNGCSVAGHYLGGLADSNRGTVYVYRNGQNIDSCLSSLRGSATERELTIQLSDGRYRFTTLGSLSALGDSLVISSGDAPTAIPVSEIESISERNYSTYRKIGLFVGLACDVTAVVWIAGRFATSTKPEIE